MHAGTFINGTSLLDDTFFENAVVFITAYDEKGAMGFVVNKLLPRKFNELDEFRDSFPLPLYEGGPVDAEHLYFVHQRPDLIKGGELVADNIYLGGDFKEAVRLLNNQIISEKDIRIFIGYCGWDSNELDAELEEGSWSVLEEVKLF